jgi:hypothetical protein
LRHLEKVAFVARRHAQLAGCHGRLLSASAASAGPAPPDTGWLPPEPEFYGNQHQWHEKYCRQRKVLRLGPRFPAIAMDAYIAPSAVVVGDVDISDAVRPFRLIACDRRVSQGQMHCKQSDCAWWTRHTHQTLVPDCNRHSWLLRRSQSCMAALSAGI